MRNLCLIVLLASSPCFAQTPYNAMMPDGSRDTYVGFALVSRPTVDDNTGSRETVLFPLLQVRWSNGIFVSGLDTVGMHLSDTPGVEYGPVLHRQFGRSAGSNPRLAGSDEINDSHNVGGFFNYDLWQNFRFISEVIATTDAPGTLLDVGVQKKMPSFAAHHTVSLSAGATFSDSAYALHHYGVRPNSTTGNAVQSYAPTGGLLNLHAGLLWNWALSASWLVSTSVSTTHYAPIVADSPMTSNRSTVSIGSGLLYRF